MTDVKIINILTVVWILIWHIYRLSESFYPPMLFWRRWTFLHSCLTTSMLKVPPNICRTTSNFNHYEYFWLTCYAHRLSQNHLKNEGRIFFISESCIGERGHILVAINKWRNTNINEGNKGNQWQALQVLLHVHVWLYDFFDMGYFTE